MPPWVLLVGERSTEAGLQYAFAHRTVHGSANDEAATLGIMWKALSQLKKSTFLGPIRLGPSERHERRQCGVVRLFLLRAAVIEKEVKDAIWAGQLHAHIVLV